jgi:hypothetical protein
MSLSPYEHMASEDFQKARFRALLGRLSSLLRNQNDQLLSLKEVKALLRPTSESYRGLRTVPIDRIVGSEGRYQDFNRAFLPRYNHLRSRWVRVDKAHHQQLTLPPVHLYEIGGVYFVRDGNHRVSVARMQGVEFIDAEVISLSSRVKLEPDMTPEQLKGVVTEIEKAEFYRQTRLAELRPQGRIDFSATGRYDELIRHIEGHKYYLNLSRTEEICFEDALLSWYDNVFEPIVQVIATDDILRFFPGRTTSDLYVWIVRHWDELKRRYGQSYPVRQAARDFALRYGQPVTNPFKRLWLSVRRITRRRL